MNAITLPPDAAQTMSSREIAELVEVRHDSVKRTMERLAEKGLISFTPSVETSHDGAGARPVEVYRVGKRDSYVIVAQLSPEFTARLVDRWQRLEERTAFDTAAALSNPDTLRSLLLENVEKVIALTSKVEADAPKVAFADQVSVAPDAISVGQAAKLLGTGRNRLSAKLREMGWLTRLNEPYQDKINAGLLDVKIGNWEHPEKGLQRSVTPLITGKGLAKLHQILGGVGREPELSLN